VERVTGPRRFELAVRVREISRGWTRINMDQSTAYELGCCEMGSAGTIDEASDVNGTDAETISHQARERSKAGSFEEAVVLYKRALALDEGRVDDLVNMGLALWSLHRNEEALAAYDHAIALDPGHALAWMNRGNALHDLGRHSEVLGCYDRALEIDSHLARGWYNKGDEMGRMGRFIEAKACFENALELGMGEAAEMVRRCDRILMDEMYS
jgi:tetratricopeptide (TPR) repeat protein